MPPLQPEWGSIQGPAMQQHTTAIAAVAPFKWETYDKGVCGARLPAGVLPLTPYESDGPYTWAAAKLAHLLLSFFEKVKHMTGVGRAPAFPVRLMHSASAGYADAVAMWRRLTVLYFELVIWYGPRIPDMYETLRGDLRRLAGVCSAPGQTQMASLLVLSFAITPCQDDPFVRRWVRWARKRRGLPDGGLSALSAEHRMAVVAATDSNPRGPVSAVLCNESLRRLIASFLASECCS